MKNFRMAVAAGLAAAGLVWSAAGQDIVPIEGATGGVDRVTLTWRTDPDSTYRVMGRGSLTDPNEKWEVTGGYVKTTGWTMDKEVEAEGNVMFFRVEKVDQQGPAFEFRSPAKDETAVSPTSAVSVAISDPSGVSTTNLAIYVGSNRFTAADAVVTWENGVLTWNGEGGETLGEPGEEVEVWATAEDRLGNTASSESSRLTIASEPETVKSEEGGTTVPFVVIGSGSQSVSDLVANVAGAAGVTAASRSATNSGTLEITGVGDDSLTFAYTGDGADLPAVGQLWASGDPNLIFYRRITVLGDRVPGEGDTGTITATTEEATLADFFEGGSFSSDDPNSEWKEYDVVDEGEGEAVSAQSRRRAVRPKIGGSTTKSFATNGVLKADWLNNALAATNVPLRFEGTLGEWDVGAGFSVAADFAVLQRKFKSCDLAVNGNVHVYLHPELRATTNAAYSNTWTKTIANVKKTFAGTIGPVPVWVDIGVEVPVALTVQAQATNASVKATIDISRALDFRWHLSDDQWRQIGNGDTGWAIARTNFTYEVTGSAGVRASIKPELTVKVYSLVGAYGWVEPYLEADAEGYVKGQNTAAPDFHYLMTAYAGLNAEIGLASTIWSESWGERPHKTFSPLRKELLRIEGTNTAPSFLSKPVDYEAEAGEAVMLSALAKGTAPLRYFWYHDGKDTGRREPYITMTAGNSTTGRYTVVVRNGYGAITNTARVTVAARPQVTSVVGTWRFLYQWEGQAANSYVARIYADGSMHDTSPSDYWWDWHVNGKTVRFETRTKWDGQSAVYRGARVDGEFLAGTMMSPAGQIGTWSMEWVSSDPEASVVGLKSMRRAGGGGDDGGDGEWPLFDPAGMPLAEAVAEP